MTTVAARREHGTPGAHARASSIASRSQTWRGNVPCPKRRQEEAGAMPRCRRRRPTYKGVRSNTRINLGPASGPSSGARGPSVRGAQDLLWSRRTSKETRQESRSVPKIVSRRRSFVTRQTSGRDRSRPARLGAWAWRTCHVLPKRPGSTARAPEVRRAWRLALRGPSSSQFVVACP